MMQDRAQYIQSRAETMQAIESTIAEVGQIFQQLATMVHEQGEQVERIDKEVDDTLQNVTQGHNELVKYGSSAPPLPPPPPRPHAVAQKQSSPSYRTVAPSCSPPPPPPHPTPARCCLPSVHSQVLQLGLVESLADDEGVRGAAGVLHLLYHGASMSTLRSGLQAAKHLCSSLLSATM